LFLEIIKYFSLSLGDLILLFFAASLIGFTKAGISGFGIIVVPIFANIFESRLSVGILLPVLIFGDFFAVWYYHRHGRWNYIIRLFPPVAIGIFLGVVIGKNIPSYFFKVLIGIIIIVGIVLTFVREYFDLNRNKMPKSILFSIIVGIFAGFFTMIGNAAGTIMTLYFLSMGLTKYEFIGTRAWYFMIVNLFKVPLHIIFWKTITFKTFMIDILLLPGILIGALLGIYLVKKIPEKLFRYAVLILTMLATIKLFI